MPRNLVILASGVTKSRYSSSPPCARKSKEDGQGCGEAATDTALAMKMATAGGAMDATTEKKCGRMLRSWDQNSVTFKYHALRLRILTAWHSRNVLSLQAVRTLAIQRCTTMVFAAKATGTRIETGSEAQWFLA